MIRSWIEHLWLADRGVIVTERVSRKTAIIGLPRFGAGLLTLLLLRGFTLLQAQPIPKLTSVSPGWIQRGTTIEITLSGEYLTNVTRLLFSSDTESNQAGIAVTELKAQDNKTLAAK